MTIVQVDHVTFGYGVDLLFEDVCFTLAAGERHGGWVAWAAAIWSPTACAADAARSGCEENTPATTCQQPSSCAARRCCPPIHEVGPPPMMARRRGRCDVLVALFMVFSKLNRGIQHM